MTKSLDYYAEVFWTLSCRKRVVLAFSAQHSNMVTLRFQDEQSCANVNGDNTAGLKTQHDPCIRQKSPLGHSGNEERREDLRNEWKKVTTS